MISPNVFISYRRKDSAAYAGRIHDDLGERFGPDRIFMDLTIEPGADFTQVLDQSIRSSAVFLVIIGPNWLRPLGDPQASEPDWVSTEVSLALRRHILVIPILVGGAHMPRRSDLPEPVRDLANREALEITDSRWGYDLGRLIQRLDKALAPQPAGPAPTPSPPPRRRVPRVVWMSGGTLVGVAIAVVVIASIVGGGGTGVIASGSSSPAIGSTGPASPSNANPSGLGLRELRAGTQGPDVVELQRRLKLYGFYAGEANGSFGEDTRIAVKGFQYCAIGVATGVVDLLTAQTLIRGPTYTNFTSGDDTIPGTPGPDILFGGDGNDSIAGGEGDDIICGGNGNDILSAGAGDDRVTGAAGDDQIEGGPGSDILGGGAGNDHVNGGGCCGDAGPADRDDIFGGTGDDMLLAANAGTATIYGEGGTDTCTPNNDEIVTTMDCESSP